MAIRYTIEERVGLNPSSKTAHTLLIQKFEDGEARVFVREVCNVDDIGQGGVQTLSVSPAQFGVSEDYKWCAHCGPR